MTTTDQRSARLDEIALPGGQFAILAIDHIDSLASTLDPRDPASISEDRIRDIKVRVVSAMEAQVGAVLLDPVIGFRGDRAEFGLGDTTGLVLGIENGDYTRVDAEPRLLPGWSVQRAAELGASAVKISFYFDPTTDTRPAEAFVSMVADQCERAAVPVFVEPLAVVSDPGKRREVILEGVKRFGSLGGDVLKIEFPEDVRSRSVDGWQEACGEVEEASPVPWTLLSAGEEFERFHQMLTVACEAGASGFLVGRAVWREVAQAENALPLGIERLSSLTAVSSSTGQSWRTRRIDRGGGRA